MDTSFARVNESPPSPCRRPRRTFCARRRMNCCALRALRTDSSSRRAAPAVLRYAVQCRCSARWQLLGLMRHERTPWRGSIMYMVWS